MGTFWVFIGLFHYCLCCFYVLFLLKEFSLLFIIFCRLIKNVWSANKWKITMSYCIWLRVHILITILTMMPQPPSKKKQVPHKTNCGCADHRPFEPGSVTSIWYATLIGHKRSSRQRTDSPSFASQDLLPLPASRFPIGCCVIANKGAVY